MKKDNLKPEAIKLKKIIREKSTLKKLDSNEKNRQETNYNKDQKYGKSRKQLER